MNKNSVFAKNSANPIDISRKWVYNIRIGDSETNSKENKPSDEHRSLL